jgi:hypothetical protein
MQSAGQELNEKGAGLLLGSYCAEGIVNYKCGKMEKVPSCGKQHNEESCTTFMCDGLITYSAPSDHIACLDCCNRAAAHYAGPSSASVGGTCYKVCKWLLDQYNSVGALPKELPDTFE